MKKILVISPHVDDDLYGCLGLLIKLAKRAEVDVKYVTSSIEQTARFNVIKPIYAEYNIKAEQLNIFEDGKGDVTPIKTIAGVFDKLIGQNYDTVLVNSLSNHQDHKAVHDAMAISLRTRPNLKIQTVLEYDYCYNQLTIDQVGCCTYFFDESIKESVNDIWLRFDKAHKVTKNINHITHPTKAMSLNEFLGAYRCLPYAERYHIAMMDILPKEW